MKNGHHTRLIAGFPSNLFVPQIKREKILSKGCQDCNCRFKVCQTIGLKERFASFSHSSYNVNYSITSQKVAAISPVI